MLFKKLFLKNSVSEAINLCILQNFKSKFSQILVFSLKNMLYIAKFFDV